MAAPLRVLVVGGLHNGACSVYRFGMHVDALAAQGVEMRALETYALRARSAGRRGIADTLADEDVELDRSELDWADVIVFRRFYPSHWTCHDCAFTDASEAASKLHSLQHGHQAMEPQWVVRPLFEAMDRYPEILRGRALVYETDDDLLNVQSWNGMWRRIAPDRGVIERMIRRADLMTVTTGPLADRFRALNDRIRVVRNAVEPAWYAVDPSAPVPEGEPRLLYYGPAARMRDYEVCRPAVDEVVAAVPGARRVWIGATGARAGGKAAPVLAAVDEAIPYQPTTAEFARALATARPHIGLAPLVGDEFDRAKSELHWLEYSMAGAATVATRIPGDGPYDPIRHGVDGFLAATPGEWREALHALATSKDLREEMAGRSRERVLAEYTVEARAPEWADAYRWAADHAGIGAAGRIHALGALPDAAIPREAAASLRHRRAAREAAEAAPAGLAARRGDREACWPAAAADDPLVTAVVPLVDEPAWLAARAVGSILAGTHPRVEAVVAVPAGADPAARAELAAAGARVVEVDLPDGLPPEAAPQRRQAVGGHLLAAGIAAASGPWITPLGPEVEALPEHVEVLLGVALEHGLEFVYGAVRVEAPGAQPVELTSWPPRQDAVLTLGTELFAAEVAAAVPVDPEAWRDGETSAWALWRTAFGAGVRLAGIDAVVSRIVLDADAAGLAEAAAVAPRPRAAEPAPVAGGAAPRAAGRSGGKPSRAQAHGGRRARHGRR